MWTRSMSRTALACNHDTFLTTNRIHIDGEAGEVAPGRDKNSIIKH